MKLVATWAATNSPVHALRVSSDGSRAVGLALKFDSVVGIEVSTWNLATIAVDVAAYSFDKYLQVEPANDLRALVARRADEPSSTVLLDLTGQVTRPLSWPAGVGAVEPTQLLSVQSVDGGLALFDGDGQRWVHLDKAYTRWTKVLWATPELIVVLSEHPKKTISVHDARDGSLIVRNAAALTSDNAVLAPGGSRLLDRESTKKPPVFTDVATGAVFKRPLLTKALTTYAFSPDGTVLAAASATGEITLLGSDATKKIGGFASGMTSPHMAWSPDGRGLFTVDGVTGALSRWDASSLGAEASPASTLAGLATRSAAKTPVAKPAKFAPPNVDTEKHGTLVLQRTRPASTLATHLADIKNVLGKALPKDVAAFYEKCDGVSYAATNAGTSLGLDETLRGLVELFDDFKPHREFRTAAAYEKASDNAELGELPFWGDTWSEDFELSQRGDLQHLNALVRSKQLVRIAGQSAALVIDFSPPASKGSKPKPYQLALAERGHRHYPLDLTFATFVEMFERFGATSWHLAYLTPAAIKDWNIDPVPTVEAGLAPFAKAFPKQVASLIARAQELSR